MGLGNGDWITGRMERHGELRYMMNGHYDIDFLSSSLSINRDTLVSFPSTTTERTNKRTVDGFTCLGDHPTLFFFFFEMSGLPNMHGESWNARGLGVLDITFPSTLTLTLL